MTNKRREEEEKMGEFIGGGVKKGEGALKRFGKDIKEGVPGK